MDWNILPELYFSSSLFALVKVDGVFISTITLAGACAGGGSIRWVYVSNGLSFESDTFGTPFFALCMVLSRSVTVCVCCDSSKSSDSFRKSSRDFWCCKCISALNKVKWWIPSTGTFVCASIVPWTTSVCSIKSVSNTGRRETWANVRASCGTVWERCVRREWVVDERPSCVATSWDLYIAINNNKLERYHAHYIFFCKVLERLIPLS